MQAENLILPTIQFCFRLDLFEPRAERSRRRQALRQTALISFRLEQFNLLRYRYLKYSLGLGD